MFTFTPLLGARSSSPALQSLLEFEGGVKILIDVGWDVSFNAELLKELERQVPTISIILLTHASVAHVGAYAHCCKHIPLFSRIPVYATTPVISLSRTLLQDQYASTPLASSFLPTSSLAESAYTIQSAASESSNILLPPPSPEEIGEYLALANQLKYLQPHQPLPSPFSPPLDGLTITAYSAGHTLGGTIWQIQYGSESIVYAVDWQQARENVFPGAAWLSGSTGAEIIEPLRQPTALICSSKGAAAAEATVGRQQRDDQLIAKTREVVKNGGNVLIPCDSSGRVLEMIYILNKAWSAESNSRSAESISKGRLYFASPTASATLRYARSQLEWMDEGIVREFEAASSFQAGQGKVTSPFEFRHVKLIERQSQLNRAMAASGAKVFLASDSSMQWGMSRRLLESFASASDNLIILTDPSHDDGPTRPVSADLAAILRRTAKGHKPAEVIQMKSDGIEVTDVETLPLAGNDLAVYQQFMARQRQRKDTTSLDKGATTLETSADAVDERSEASSSSDDESDNEQQGKSMNISAALTSNKNKLGLTDEELGINVLLRKKNVHDFDVRGKRGRDKVFPFMAKRRRNDDFGDLIRQEEYLQAEERDDVDGEDTAAQSGKGSNALGSKRKWGDNDTGPGSGKKRRLSAQGLKRRRGQQKSKNADTTPHADGADAAASDEEASDESDYEPAEAIVRGPMKASVTQYTIMLQMKLTSVDFSGIHDQRSLQMLIPLIKPRKLILTGGSETDTLSLADTCRKLLANPNSNPSKEEEVQMVFTPSRGETVDASVDMNAWTIKLSQSLFRKLQWQSIRSLGIVTINGRLELEQIVSGKQAESDAKRQKTEVKESSEPISIDGIAQGAPVLNDLPLNLASSTRLTNQPLHVGDLRLAELRKIMQANGHTAEFKGEGTLLVDGLIAVRKSGIGRIEVEGGGLAFPGAAPRHPDISFNSVKKKIYEGLAVVAAR